MEGIIIFLLMVIGLISFVCFVVSGCCEEFKETIISAFICVVCSFLLFYPMYKGGKMNYERPNAPYVTHEIMALADGHAINGRIYMRRGYINEIHQYTYGYKTEKGGMKTQQVNTDAAIVYFNDNVNPHAEWYKETKSFWYLNWEKYTCDIYLPNDALVADYTIDLQ